MSNSGSFTLVLTVICLLVLMSLETDAQSCSESLEKVLSLVEIIASNQNETAEKIKKIASVQQEIKEQLAGDFSTLEKIEKEVKRIDLNLQENTIVIKKIASNQQENANDIKEMKELIGGNSSAIKEVRNVVSVIASNQQENANDIKDMKELIGGNSSVIKEVKNVIRTIASNQQQNTEKITDVKELLASNTSAFHEVLNVVKILAVSQQVNADEIIDMKELLTGNSSVLQVIANVVKRIASNQENAKLNVSKSFDLATVDPAKRENVSALINNCVPLLIQQNMNRSNVFFRSWAEFKVGFNDSRGNYWLGNDLLSQLTLTGRYKLRFDLQSRKNSNWYYAEYSTFTVQPESDNYRLNVSGYLGNAGYDAFGSTRHNGQMFSTSDRDNDHVSGSCAAYYGGFWHKNCCYCCVNGYHDFGWYRLPGGSALKSTRMWLQCK